MYYDILEGSYGRDPSHPWCFRLRCQLPGDDRGVETSTQDTGRGERTIRYERDVARASMLALVPIATDEQEQEFIREMQTAAEPGGLAKLIAELEAAHG